MSDVKIVGLLCNWCCYGGADTEEKLEELEKLVKQLESDNVPLKEAVELYTQANILLKECNTELNDTKATIQKISEDGALEEF